MGQKVYFLPLSKKGKEKLAEAEVHMVNAKLQWVEISCDEINSKDCLKDYMDKSIFIVSPLEGDAYDKLVANGAKVYGVGALISSLQLKSSLPRKAKDFTQGCISSMALRQKNVCFTNVPKEEREVLQKKVSRMAGYISSTMTQDVDILVVGEASSKKYIVASELKIKTVTPDFVEETWKLSVEHLRPIIPDCDLYNELLKTHACPVFHGLGISVTNIDQQSRMDIADLVVANGGSYNGILERTQVTQLVAGGPGGKKIKHARAWGIDVVTMQWVEDSVKRGFAQNTEQKEYKFDEESFVEQQSQIENTSKGFVNETEASIVDEKTDMFDLDKFVTKEHDIEEDAFNRVSAFISGFPARGKRKLKELIQKGGGMVFDSLTPSITHMIVARQSLENNEDLAYWRSMTSGRPIAIDLFWVINTIKNGERENPEGYKVLNMEGTVNEGDETLRMEARSFNGDLPREPTVHEQSTFGTLEVTETQAAESSLHSPLLNSTKTTRTTTKSSEKQSSVNLTTRKSHKPSNIEPTRASIVDDRVTVRILPGGEDHPMYKVFFVEDFWNRRKARLVKNIDPEESVDYVISFLIVRGDLAKWEGSFESCFYFEALENCDDIETIEDHAKTKVYWCASKRLFSGVGFCAARYVENEKIMVSQAAEAGGGKFSASMDRDVTHVIAPYWDGPKQARAVAQALPCITIDWIIACLERSLVDNSLTWHSVPMEEFEPTGVKPKPALPKPVASSKKSRKADRYASVMVESPCVTSNGNGRTPKIVNRPDLSEMAKFVETPKNMRDPTLPTTTECKRILKQAVEDSDVERCKRDKIGIYSKSAQKEREKRQLEPKTPVAKNVPKLVFDNLVPEKGIFDGYSLYIHESIQSQRNLNVIDKIENLGADISMDYKRNKNFTHCVIADTVDGKKLKDIIKFTSEYSIALVRFAWLEAAVVKNKVPDVKEYQNFKYSNAQAALTTIKTDPDPEIARDSQYSTPDTERSNSRRGRKKRSRSRMDDRENIFSGSDEEGGKISRRGRLLDQDDIEELSSGDFETQEVDLRTPARLKKIANEKHRILFSLVSKPLQEELKKMIKEINGSSVSSSPSYDPTSTMLIFDRDPIRNEKISASIVSGKPVLHQSYIRKSYENNKKWLDPLDHMYKVNVPESVDAKSMRAKSEAQDVLRAMAYWYEYLQKYPGRNKVFGNWTVWLMYNGVRGCPSKSFNKILIAGGAEVLGQGLSWPEIEKHIDELTHILAPKENDALFDNERLAICLDNGIKLAVGDVISKAITGRPPGEGVLEATSFLPGYEAARNKKYKL